MISSDEFLAKPRSITIDHDGSILVADIGFGKEAHHVVRVDSASGEQALVASFDFSPDFNATMPIGITVVPIPEPSAMLLLAGSLATLGIRRSRHGPL